MNLRPALQNYINRIGAKERNFRRYVIEKEDPSAYAGGKRTIASIHIDNEGTIDCSSEEYAPTAEEAEAIKKEIANAPFPNWIPARKGTLPKQLEGVDRNHLCIFYDRSGEEILMIQHRKDGQKPDLPFTMWSDGVWRCMEPDGKLPLFGLEKLKLASTVMLHEGAKAARDVQAMVNAGGEALAAHPWGEDLKLPVHLGWPGGAENADRVDWTPLKRLPPHVRIIVVCDNDQVGKEALARISAILQRSMSAIIFDDRFQAGFDLADRWPHHPDWWSKEGRYRGPSFDDCLVPATWAMQVIKTKKFTSADAYEADNGDSNGRPAHEVRKEFVDEWYYVEDPFVFIHKRQTNRLRAESVFNHSVRPFSNVDNTARLLLRNVSARCDGVAYRPCRTEGRFGAVITVDGRRLVNTFRPTSIKPIKGNVRPFLRFLLHLFPNRSDCREVMRRIATLIARPDIRMHYSLLLVSETQGVGKGTLGEAILAPLVGLWNCSFPTEQQVVDSSFNSWVAHKRLAVIHEIYSGQSRKGYDRLKSVITDTMVDVNQKFMAQYTVENYLQVVACSNSQRALHLDDGDRRWLVPHITEKQRPAGYWRDLYDWLKGDGLGIIRQWAEDHAKKPGVMVEPGEHAPMTTAKKEVIDASRSEGQKLAYALGEQVLNLKGEQVVLAIEDVREWVARERELTLSDHRLEKSYTLCNALRAAGMHEPAPPPGQTYRRFSISSGGKTIKSYVVANFAIEPGADWSELNRFYKKPHDVWRL